MLLYTRRAQRIAWAVFAFFFLLLFALPFGVLVLAAFTKQWNGAFPSSYTFSNVTAAFHTDPLDGLETSLITALLSSLIALVLGTWAALALDAVRNRVGKTLIQTVFMLPIAVPSVVVGLALLVAFSQGPVLLNGTNTIVVMAHSILVTAYAFQQVSAAVTRLDPAYEQAAASLGARPYYTLLRVKLPLLLPALTGSLALCFALSMGELGATAMVYSANWTTLPLRIYALDDRGHQFVAAAVTAVMMTITLAVLLVVSRIRTRANYR
ncbi:ABC transporter permease [Catenulispora pinisilvae]|uniref:ABC transporter permease n=1 Tax=Catenulispora pinisilvae TaxID=2705253 RepID=UPI00189214F2|nr:ABC transporter permease subunit [Catenulispora pinisilvae]